jgi:hypothetical protein
MSDLAKKMKAVLDDIRALPKAREQSLAITKLEECAYWTALAVDGIVSPIDRLQETGTRTKKPSS